MKILMLDMMSSEETGSESGSGEEMGTRRKIFFSKPLGWRSREVTNYFESLDRKFERRRSQGDVSSKKSWHSVFTAMPIRHTSMGFNRRLNWTYPVIWVTLMTHCYSAC